MPPRFLDLSAISQMIEPEILSPEYFPPEVPPPFILKEDGLLNYGRMLGCRRIGHPHLDRIYSWAVSNRVLYSEGQDIITGYLDDAPQNQADHIAFLKRSLEIVGLVDEMTDEDEMALKIAKLEEGWLITAPGTIEKQIEKNHDIY